MDRAMIVGMLKDWGIAFAITLLILLGWRALSPKPASEGLAPVLHDSDGRTASTWGVHSFPTTFVLDADRRIVHVQVGMMSAQALQAAVDKAL